jgi:hypothetical protein
VAGSQPNSTGQLPYVNSAGVLSGGAIGSFLFVNPCTDPLAVSPFPRSQVEAERVDLVVQPPVPSLLTVPTSPQAAVPAGEAASRQVEVGKCRRLCAPAVRSGRRLPSTSSRFRVHATTMADLSLKRQLRLRPLLSPTMRRSTLQALQLRPPRRRQLLLHLTLLLSLRQRLRRLICACSALFLSFSYLPY